MLIRYIILAVTVLFLPLRCVCQQSAADFVSEQQHMLRAQQLMQQQHPELAIREYEAVLAVNSVNMDAQANLGVLLYFGRHYAQAVPHLRSTVEAKPDQWKLRALLGLAESHLPDPSTEQSDLEAAFPHLKGERIQTEVGDALIHLYTAKGDLEKAVPLVSELLQVDPANARLLLLDYRLHSDLASRALVSLALAAPKSAEIHAAMARELGRQRNESAAVENYRAALALEPHMQGLAFEFGTVLYRSTDDNLRSQAEAEFKAAVKDNPKDEKAQLMLGEIAATRGDNLMAFDDDSRAVDLQPDDVDACVELAKILITMKQPDKARALLEHAIAVDPTSATAHYRLSTLERQQGHPEAAKKELTEYQRYKDLKDKLGEVFQAMRVSPDKPEAADAKLR